ncbi:MAG: hypothetical protein ACP5N2_02860 [Candidatus Nanoarchaeia archaeon]
MVYFTSIQPTNHYIEEHEKDVPWNEVIEVILFTKNPRKKDGKFEIDNDKYYLLFKIENQTVFVINAKRK